MPLRDIQKCATCVICRDQLLDGRRALVHLSCTHVFHSRCFAAFEQHAAQHGVAAMCPLCRCSYVKRHLSAGQVLQALDVDNTGMD